MKSSKSNTKIPVATNFFEASSLRHFSQRLQLRGAQGTLKLFTNLMFFTNHCYDNIYGMGIFIKLADNEPSDCRVVARINSPKWGLFGSGSCAAQCAVWAGGIGPREFGNRLSWIAINYFLLSSFRGSFALRSSAFSGLPQAS